MISRLKLILVGTASILSLLVACNGSKSGDGLLPINANQAAQTINENSLAVAQSLSPVIKELNATLGDYCKCAEETECACQPPTDLESKPEDVAKWISDHLFQEQRVNPTLSSDTEVVFCLQAPDVCNDENNTVDEKCSTALQQIPICVRVRSYAEKEVDANVLVGANQEYNPANIYIRPNHLSADVSLTDIGNSFRAFMTAAQQQIPENFPSLIKGKITADLKKVSEKAISLALGISEAIEIDLFPAEHAKHVELRIAASPNLLVLAADADKKQIDSQLDLGSVDLMVPAETVLHNEENDVENDSAQLPIPGNFFAHLDSAKISATLIGTDNVHSISMHNISLGNQTSTVQYSKSGLRTALSTIIKVDLNPSLNRTLDAIATETDQGLKLQVTPGLELIIDHDFTSIQKHLEDASEMVLKAVTRIEFSETGTEILFSEEDEAVKVLSGKVKLGASGMEGLDDINITADGGQCIMEKYEDPPENEHPFANLIAGSCQ